MTTTNGTFEGFTDEELGLTIGEPVDHLPEGLTE